MNQPITDLRRKRILYRATHRGTKEADAVVGGYFSETVAAIPDAQLDEVEEFLEIPDLDIMDWVMGRAPVPERWGGSLFDAVRAYYQAIGRR
jgi:antitoxin CptB